MDVSSVLEITMSISFLMMKIYVTKTIQFKAIEIPRNCLLMKILHIPLVSKFIYSFF